MNSALSSLISSAITPIIVAVVGPTASGKSALGINLAQTFDGEIINCDSVQVYREIEIATAKVPLSERGGVPHHLIDFVPPEVNYTAGAWARAATEKIKEIERRGSRAVIVGGTGFYLRALREPLSQSDPTDPRLRERFVRLRERRGAIHLHRMLRRVDPLTASKLHERDWARVQRALEVRFQIHQPLSAPTADSSANLSAAASSSSLPPPLLAGRLYILALNPPRAELYQRIDKRTEQHFECGLIGEVRRLLERGVPVNSNALGAHGYRRVIETLRGQRASIASALEQTKLDVRHYAKRQLTWFRREPVAIWLEGFGDDPRVQQAARERVAAALDNDLP